MAVGATEFCVLLVPSVSLMFSLEYTGNQKWLNKRGQALLFFPALIFGLLAITLPMNYLVSVEVHFGIEVVVATELVMGVLLLRIWPSG